ncbi:MAG TPA: hypothetical protein VFQ30_19615 [Ktedonobacteraceae bacterium]|nr:hypothetical protein [Ktedonobacteraceae bacterium]
MIAQTDERDRILRMVEAGKVTAEEAAQLLDALAEEREHPLDRSRSRTLRIRVTGLNPKQQKFQMAATIPVSLIRISLRLGSRLIPQLSNSALEDLLRSIEHGASGRLLDVQDLEEGQRVEIFAE